MAQKVKISDFLAYYEPHAVITNSRAPDPPPDRQYGYVMGGDGRTATDAYIKRRAKSSYPNDWEAYYRAYKKWLGHRVFDCNSLAEVFYKERTGRSIDTKARSNYANWCSDKDSAPKDGTLKGLPQFPGVALFSGPSASGITHVGFLFKKTGPGDLDWHVLEARGKDYGVVITDLKARSWEWWGVMDKYFYYDLDADWRKVGTTTPSIPASNEITIGDTVEFGGTKHYTNSNAANGKSCKPGKAQVTNIAKASKHPYHLVRVQGGGSTVYGWVDAADIRAEGKAPSS